MDNVRFSIIANDLEWTDHDNNHVADRDNQNHDHESSEVDEKRSISSESNGEEAILSSETHTIFHRNQHDHTMWTEKEIDDMLKSLPNASEILKIITWRNFFNLISGSKNVNLALLFSSWYGCSENVSTLLETYLANPNFCDPKGRTPLHFACCIGDAHIAKMLLDHGADPNLWDNENKATPLHCAASAGSVDCILLLLKRKACINVGIERRTALHVAIDKNYVECAEILLKYGADPNTPQVFTETPLHTASALGHKESVALLLKYGAAVGAQFGKRKLTALHLAAEDDYVDCVQMLLEHGAQVDARNADDQTALHLACLSQCLETLDLLLKYGANVNTVYKNGRTALHAAIVKQSRCLECVRALLKAGINVNKADDYGYTPLHISALNEFGACVYMLIEHGADITARTNGGVTALSFIVRRTPEIIPKLVANLDSCIKVNDHEIGDVDCEIKLDFRLLVPSMERGETELLLAFIEVGQKRILKHPLCETFLFLKWRRIRKFFLMSLFFHALYVLLFTLYILGVYIQNCKEIGQCPRASYTSPLGYLVIFLNLILMAKELFQMTQGIYGYARYWENWLQWSIIFGVFLCVTPETCTSDKNLCIVPEWQHHVAAVVIFLVWLELMMLVGRFPIFGLYVQMFTKVAVNFAKFLVAYCCLLVAFGLGFCVLFTNYPAFEKVPWGLLKTVAMMAGELEFEDIFYGDYKILYPVTSHILFFSFVLLVTVILTNLLVGLAVSDIQGLQASAGLDRLIRQAELVSRLESLFFSLLIRKAPLRLMKICQRSALLRTSRYQLQFLTRPNDPRDKQLPEELKINIYKLVAERRDRNQSIKRRRRESNLSIFKRSLDRRRDDSILRPRSTSIMRNRIVSDNPQISMKYRQAATHKDNLDCVAETKEMTNIKFQLSNITEKLDKLNEDITKKLNTATEELIRIKLHYDQKRNFIK